jgi:hypothetical protein
MSETELVYTCEQVYTHKGDPVETTLRRSQIEKWHERLLSGERKQTQGALCDIYVNEGVPNMDDKTYCCLGVYVADVDGLEPVIRGNRDKTFNDGKLSLIFVYTNDFYTNRGQIVDKDKREMSGTLPGVHPLNLLSEHLGIFTVNPGEGVSGFMSLVITMNDNDSDFATIANVVDRELLQNPRIRWAPEAEVEVTNA